MREFVIPPLRRPTATWPASGVAKVVTDALVRILSHLGARSHVVRVLADRPMDVRLDVFPMSGSVGFHTDAVTAVMLALCVVSQRHHPEWPGASTPDAVARVSAEARRIEGQSVCVGSRVWSAGELAPTVAYRAQRIGDRLFVGYFVRWTTERPWGNNAMTYTVVPALAVDAVYSHFLLGFSGVRDVLYGPDDVEGVTVEYREVPDGSLEVVAGVADDGAHGRVTLSRSELVDAKGRVVLLTNVWSHQLGAHGGAAYAAQAGSELHCYRDRNLVPLPERVARDFHLGSERAPRRAKPAWLGARAFQSARSPATVD